MENYYDRIVVNSDDLKKQFDGMMTNMKHVIQESLTEHAALLQQFGSALTRQANALAENKNSLMQEVGSALARQRDQLMEYKNENASALAETKNSLMQETGSALARQHTLITNALAETKSSEYFADELKRRSKAKSELKRKKSRQTEATVLSAINRYEGPKNDLVIIGRFVRLCMCSQKNCIKRAFKCMLSQETKTREYKQLILTLLEKTVVEQADSLFHSDELEHLPRGLVGTYYTTDGWMEAAKKYPHLKPGKSPWWSVEVNPICRQCIEVPKITGGHFLIFSTVPDKCRVCSMQRFFVTNIVYNPDNA